MSEELTVLDLSQFNGTVDWNSIRADAVILRAGYRGYNAGSLTRDTAFARNLAGANARGIPVGVYWVSQAVNEAEAREEADFVLSLCSQGSVTWPVFLDSEYSGEPNARGRGDLLTRARRTACGLAFCQAIQAAGRRAGLYCSEDWFTAMLDGAAFRAAGYSLWIAKYSSREPAVKGLDGWQYTGSGAAAGVPGKVDISRFYVNYTAAPDELDARAQWDAFYAAKQAELKALPPEEWSREGRDFCMENGIIRGYADGSYGWALPVTRQELAVMLQRLAQLT